MAGSRTATYIPKETSILNSAMITGLEFTIKGILRHVPVNESFERIISPQIYSYAQISQLGKTYKAAICVSESSLLKIRVEGKYIIPLCIQLCKYLQYASQEFHRHNLELSEIRKLNFLALSLIRGLDPTLRIHHYIYSFTKFLWKYYFEDYETPIY